jgi:ATP-dependent exoDNAse (exonuclease V) beta subunit
MAIVPTEVLPGPSPLLDENLVLRAGAGTGKTHALVTLALQLLAGLRRKGAVPAEQLWLLTFTDKAAAELRGRLQARLRRLAAGPVPRDGEEAALWSAADHLGLAFPGPRRWAELLEASAGCRVTTLHGAGAALLRELPGGPGSFRLWDEAESGQALQTAARAAALAPGAPSDELLEDMHLNARGPRDGGLVGALVSLHRRLAEDGLDVAGLTPPVAPASLVPALQAWRASFEALLAEGKLKEPELVRRALALEPEAADPELLSESWDILEAAADSFQKRGDTKKAAGAAHDALAQAIGEIRAARLWESCRTLYGDMLQRYREAKKGAFALDFADLCSRARDLLRDNPAARRAAKERVGALLLDETQDTNRVQLDMCLLLCERRGSERHYAPGDPLHERVELEPGTLCAVGDRKQSIYEFRGADVAVFEWLAERVRACEGRELALQSCRRSRPELVSLYNDLFGRAMAHGDRNFEIRFDAGDVLQPIREPAGGPLAELVRVSGETSSEQRRAEAEALARRAVQLLARPPAHLAAIPGGLRPGHFALLFRRLGYVEIFREAFRQHGLPSAVAGGDGFYEVQEVRDAAALLGLCADPDDGRALLTLLRSPLCGVLDETAVRLALAPGFGLHLRKLAARRVAGLADAEAELVDGFSKKLQPLWEAAEQLGSVALLDAAEQAFGLRSLYRDSQAAANLDKLRGVLARWEHEGLGVAAAADRLGRFARGEGEGSREPQASGFDDASLGAVRMLSIHQAKGLEFPVVFVPECGFVRRPDAPPVLFARDEGLGVKARGPTGKWVQPPAFKGVQAALVARERAESLRLLYVAATRAQEQLIFSGELGATGSRVSWRSILDQEPGLVRVDGEGLPDGRYEAPASGNHGDARAALEATEPLASIPLTRPALAATAVADLLLCPRRYQLRQLWRLPERPGQPELPEEIPGDGDPRELGSRAHELLETVDLAVAARDPQGAVARAAEKLGFEPGSEGSDDRKLAGEVTALLASPLGRRICELPPKRVWRELPFALRAGPLVIRGAIDLLCVLDDCLLVVDYKRGPPRARAGYRAQVDIYALAASRIVGEQPGEQPGGQLPIEGALWYLGEAAGGPHRWPVGAARLAELSESLAQAGERAAAMPAGHDLWSGLEAQGCKAIDCGYLPRCHPRASR